MITSRHLQYEDIKDLESISGKGAVYYWHQHLKKIIHENKETHLTNIKEIAQDVLWKIGILPRFQFHRPLFREEFFNSFKKKDCPVKSGICTVLWTGMHGFGVGRGSVW